jgi:acyl-CoA thioester hydrolase
VTPLPSPEHAGEFLARGIHRCRVEWIDTDAAGIHHNTAITRYVEAAEGELMRSRGLRDYVPRAPRVRYEVDFEAPLRAGQEVTAVIDLLRIGTSSMTFVFEVWGENFGGRPRRRAAAGRLITVHVPGGHAGDAPARSSPWPADWVTALQRQ